MKRIIGWIVVGIILVIGSVIGSVFVTSGAVAQEFGVATWEYMVIEIDVNDASVILLTGNERESERLSDDIVAQLQGIQRNQLFPLVLNIAGTEGWELVDTEIVETRIVNYYFKRLSFSG